MADDAVGLLDALNIKKAVIFGGSMGGMIAQLVLLNYTSRVSACVLAFTSGRFPLPHSSIRGPIMRPIPAGLSMEQLLVETNEKQNLIAGAAMMTRGRTPEQNFDYHKEIMLPTLERKDYWSETGGKRRQTEAIICSPKRFARLRQLYGSSQKGKPNALLDEENVVGLPEVILFHGEDDLMVQISESVLLHQAIPGSRFIRIPNMGHEVHPVHFDEVINIVKSLNCHYNNKS
jgi:pimeloyl-ACP methyl ester carboxylesterase